MYFKTMYLKVVTYIVMDTPPPEIWSVQPPLKDITSLSLNFRIILDPESTEPPKSNNKRGAKAAPIKITKKQKGLPEVCVYF